MYKSIEYQSQPIYYREEAHGKGFPILLIHGLAEDGAIWDEQVAALQKDNWLIIPCLPGSGSSPLLQGTPSIDALADAVKGLCDAIGIGQCIMIGHSMGGYIALAFAEKYPETLRAFGLFHSTAYADTHEKKSNRHKCIDFIDKTGAPAYIRQSTPNLFAQHTRQRHPKIVGDMIDRYAGFQQTSLIYYQEAMINRPERVSVLGHFRGPVLFVIGEEDTAVPMSLALQQCHLPVLSHVHILEHTGHMGMLEAADDSNRILQTFINFTLNS
jgi:pimeloyl-ACP methyl ester carboxylesterase